MKFVTNDSIKADKVFLLDHEGQNKGVVSKREAMYLAVSVGMDLVAMDLRQDPPVCKIADLGKLQYQMEKKQDKPKKKLGMKEIRLRPITERHDLEVKVRKANELLEEGHKVKISMVFEGREISHQEVAKDTWTFIRENLNGEFEKEPRLEGRISSVMVNHRPANKAKPPKI